MAEFAIDQQACRGRQRRLVHFMQQQSIDLAIITQMENIQWLTGARVGPLFEPVAAITAQGHATLVAPSRKMPDDAAVDELVPYEAQLHSTMRNDQRVASSQALLAALESAPRPATLGVEYSSFGPHLAGSFATEQIDIEPELYRLRRRKDPDELRLMKHAIAATGAMYEHARQVIKPGINELDLFSQLHAVAVEALGEPVTYFGQDFQCNAKGGPPRDRAAQAGELYILDLGAGFRGYFSDNARTIAVDGKPTDEQQEAWDQIQHVFALVESTVKPGVSCRDIFEKAQVILDACPHGKFDHHLGHGVGLYPHEAPHLNPNWDDVFEQGDLFTVEPGLYGDGLRHGMRLEQNYLVTERGVERLTHFPLEL